jgi:hypothetical protein
MGGGKHALGGVVAIAASMLAPGLAQAATTIGQTSAPYTCGGGQFTILQEAVAAPPSYAIPAGGGVITSWSLQANSLGSQFARLKVYRRTGVPSQFTVIGEGNYQALVPSALHTFPTQIPTQEGDVLGLTFNSGTGMGCAISSPFGDQIRQAMGDPSVGSTVSFGAPVPGARVNVSAVLEPDCDSDGRGDETQDSSVDCAPPDTQITKGPQDKTKKRTATFEFSSSEPASTFECSLDGSSVTLCTSPHTVTVKKGLHSFAVRATDAVGNVDGSPATDDWSVKKKKKR